MNKYVDAIKWFGYAHHAIKQYQPPLYVGALFYERWNENQNLLNELVKKETPLKPYSTIAEEGAERYPLYGLNAYCGICSRQLFETHKYCSNCGQKIDWSDANA